MADPPRFPEADDTGVDPDHGPPGMPRWVKVSGIFVGVLVLLGIVVMMLGGGGGVQHGPGLHGSGANGDPDHGDDATPIAGASPLAVTAGDLRFDPGRVELPAGMPVNVALTATGILHDLVVDEIDSHLAADRDETVVGAGLVFTEPAPTSVAARCRGIVKRGWSSHSSSRRPMGHTPPVQH